MLSLDTIYYKLLPRWFSFYFIQTFYKHHYTLLHINTPYYKDFILVAVETTGDHTVLEFRTIEIGSLTHANGTSTERTADFIGHMQQLLFNGYHFFEMAESGQMSNFEITANFGKRDHIIQRPVTFQSTNTYVVLERLVAYEHLNLYFQFKTLAENGLLLYSSGSDQDFLGVELVKGHIHVVFNLGDGPRVVRSVTQKKLSDHKWHDVTLMRPSVDEYTLIVDDTMALATDTGPAHHLDLQGNFYVGGVPARMYSQLPSIIVSRMGYHGCFASLDMNSRSPDLMKDALEAPKEVVDGCQGWC